MGDRLVSLLKRFELRAQLFQNGPVCRSALFDSIDGYGYIHLLRAGCMRVETVGEKSVELNQPGLVFYMAPTKHRLIPVSESIELVCASFEFGAGLHNPLVKALPGMVMMTLEELPGISSLLGTLFREAAEEHCGRQAILDRLAEVLIILLLRELMDQEKIEFGLLAGLSDPRLANAINAIHADPSNPWTLQELASLANMSRARFAKRFHEIVGTTPMNYLAEWRLSAARSMLVQGKSVQQTADSVGYSSASSLSRAFTAQTGLSPRAWLQKQVLNQLGE
jgi:AraC-like DNA-binding protein